MTGKTRSRGGNILSSGLSHSTWQFLEAGKHSGTDSSGKRHCRTGIEDRIETDGIRGRLPRLAELPPPPGQQKLKIKMCSHGITATSAVSLGTLLSCFHAILQRFVKVCDYHSKMSGTAKLL